MKRLSTLLLAVAVCAACNSAAATSNGRPTPVYNKDTGRLEQLLSDRNGDGKVDTRAFMDGVRFKSIEIDRNGDGRPDRWEYYEPAPGAAGSTQSVLVRAEEANGPTGAITRKEFYEAGKIHRVEEDTDADGRIDKWEFYENGALVRIDFDLQGKGFADRRIYYDANGVIERLEVDPDGDGKFDPAPIPAQAGKGRS